MPNYGKIPENSRKFRKRKDQPWKARLSLKGNTA